MTRIERKTKETRITVAVGEPGVQTAVQTPHPFLTHMVESFSKHSGLSVQLKAESLDAIEHHVVEDTALTLGSTLRQLLGSRPRRRFGDRMIVMDDALVAVALDTGGRPYYVGELPMPLYEHFLRSLAFEAEWTLHVEIRRGRDEHHIVEAAFKGTALCLRDAMAPVSEIASTKGEVEVAGQTDPRLP